MSHLEQSLQLLSSHLDQVVFRETWRVVAAATNRMLYNDVSIQAVFSQEVSASECGAPFELRGAVGSRDSKHVQRRFQVRQVSTSCLISQVSPSCMVSAWLCTSFARPKRRRASKCPPGSSQHRQWSHLSEDPHSGDPQA